MKGKSKSHNGINRISVDGETLRFSQRRIPVWKILWRKGNAVRVLFDKKWDGHLSQADFFDKMFQLKAQLQKSTDISEKTVGLWTIEKLGYSFAKYHLHENHNIFNDDQLPVEFRELIYTGIGMAMGETSCFSPSKITDTIESLPHPDFRRFAYEVSGVFLAVAPAVWCLRGFQVVATQKLPHLDAPEPREFLSHFSSEIQGVMAHGYGRGLYFIKPSLNAAIRTAVETDFLATPMILQGMAVAYTMVNHRDLYLVLESHKRFENSSFAEAFQKGFIFALKLWEQTTPGFLATLRPPTFHQSQIIAAAQREIETGRKQEPLNNGGQNDPNQKS